MKKTRIYELAKELNTTSKRLLEKLAEINISVKNHMSYLDENQLNALYDHIGVIRHNKSSAEAEGKTPKPPKASTKTEPQKETSDIPTIIRKTVIDTEDDVRKDRLFDENARKDIKANEGKKKRRRDFVKVADESTGLRPGLTRSTGFDYVNELLNEKKAKRQKEEQENNLKEKKEEATISAEGEREVIKPIMETDKRSTEKQEKEEIRKPEKGTSEKTEKIEAEQKPQENKKEDVPARDNAVEAAQKTVKQTPKGDIEKGPAKTDSESLKKPDKHKEAEIKNKSEGKAIRDIKSDKEDKSRLSGKAPKGKERKDEFDKTRPEPKKGGSTADYFGTQEIIQPPLADIIDTADQSKSKPRIIKKEYENKYHGKEEKKESKKEIIKPSARKKKISPDSLVISDKKKISEVLIDDYILDDFLDEAPFGKKKVPKPKKENKKAEAKPKHVPQKAVLTSIKIPDTITVKDLAEALKKTAGEVIKTLMGFGVMATVNQEIDFDTATIVADEFGVKTEKEVTINEEDILFDESEDNESDLVPRPPVVVVMGHVDHGKTSLLDAIRKTNVTDTEEGGITQHIGAYMVEINGRKITFLDTPGHEAFTSMRARGAQVTDIAVLVVSADDGIMPQTVEAINHAKAANVSIIVAINKIDKPGANPDRVKQQLTEYGLLPEEWGGETICVNVSALHGTNIDELLEMILLTADMLELKANPNKQAKGTVIEAKLDRNRGAVATLLVQRGTLRNGDTLIAGTAVGNIRAMVNDKGQKIDAAPPSTPVEVLGLDEVPKAGEIFYAVADEKLARQLAEKRKQSIRDDMIKARTKVTLEDLFSQIQAGNVKELNIIVKADVQGSVEAVRQSLEKLSNDEVRINIVHGGVGAINESDVKLAEVTNAIIIGFNVRPGSNVMEIAKNAGVDMRMYRIIYDAIEDVQKAMKGMLEPTFREVIIGHAEVRQIFKVSGLGTIGGCYVTDGKIQRNSEVRVVRDGVVVHEGKLSSLKRFKDDVREVAQGFECGLMVERFNDIKENDVIECFIMEEVRE